MAQNVARQTRIRGEQRGRTTYPSADAYLDALRAECRERFHARWGVQWTDEIAHDRILTIDADAASAATERAARAHYHAMREAIETLRTAGRAAAEWLASDDGQSVRGGAAAMLLRGFLPAYDVPPLPKLGELGGLERYSMHEGRAALVRRWTRGRVAVALRSAIDAEPTAADLAVVSLLVGVGMPSARARWRGCTIADAIAYEAKQIAKARQAKTTAAK